MPTIAYPGLPPEPKLSPMIDVAPKPMPVTPEPPKPEAAPVPTFGLPPEPQKIRIEPDVRLSDDWPPPEKPEAAPAAIGRPVKILVESKRMPKHDVEDIIETPDGEYEYGSGRGDLRPAVRTGVYRTIAVAFVALALAVGALVMYVAYARADVTVHPRRVEVSTERALDLTAEPQGDQVTGQVFEAIVSGERSGNPSEATIADGVAGGFVTIVNESDDDQALVATTRLLAPDGTLFRLKGRVNIPSKGSVKTEAYADQAGPGGDIAPTRFTIPGLSAALQKVIYAESDAAMKGGRVATGVVSQADVDTIDAALREELTAQAKRELEAKAVGAPSGRAYEIEDISRFQSAASGETADGITVRLSLRVRMAAFDRSKALEVVGEDLRRGLTSDRELAGIDADAAEFVLDDADPKQGTGTLRTSVRGEARVSLESPLFDATKLRGLDLEAVQAYFQGIEGVEKVDVSFRPFWLKRMPDLADHITFRIEP